MLVAGVVALLGLCGPFAIRARAAQQPPAAVNASHLACLLAAWTGLIALVGHAAPHTLLGLCEVLLPTLLRTASVPDQVGGVVLVILLLGRAALETARLALRGRRLGRTLREHGERTGRRVACPSLGTVAVTVGFLRPLVVVDPERLALLHDDERQAVLAHERGHAEGRHPLVHLVVSALAAGLAPWPGAAVAREEVRRHLEAEADDYAARRTGPMAVVSAIAAAGGATPGPMLGASGWPIWRVQRLLSGPPSRRMVPVAAVAVAIAGAVTTQAALHGVVGVHLSPLLDVLC